MRLVWLNLEALPALSGRPSESFLAAPFEVGSRATYVALLPYPWVRFGLGVVVGGYRGRALRGR